ncbi:mok13 [Symbiodinium natans]|uniref:Mok13 protein n=1 Tax=Symbiodinium natans TaxID=878477 RepID=A0A812IGN6_9DINO|nr:mok13 [Symbiodinium natans]
MFAEEASGLLVRRERPELRYLGSTGSVDGVNLCVASPLGQSEATYWSKERGEPLEESVRQRLGWGDSLPVFLRHQSFFVRCGSSLLYRPGGYDFTSLPIDVNASEVEGGLLFTEIFQDDYFELNTMNPVLQELYTNLLKYWIAEVDIDGYRITAASHITADFSAYLSTHLRFYAAALGKENFFVVGEVNQATTPYGGSHIGRVQPGTGPATLPQKVQGTLEELCQYYSALPEQVPGFLSTYPLQEVYQLRDTCLGTGWNAMDLYQQPGAAKAVRKARDTLKAQGDMRLSMAAVEPAYCNLCLFQYRKMRDCNLCLGTSSGHGHRIPKGQTQSVCGLTKISSYFFRNSKHLRPSYVAKIAHGTSEADAKRQVKGAVSKTSKLKKQEAKMLKAKEKHEEEEEEEEEEEQQLH